MSELEDQAVEKPVPADDTASGASIARSSGVMAAGTIVSRVTGFARDIVVAGAIGTASLSDAFKVAHTLPTILYVLLAGGVLNAVFVPQLVRAMKSDADGGDGYADRLLTLSGLVLFGITVVACLAAPLITHLYVHDWTPAEFHIVVLFAYFSLPQIFFYGITTMLGQVLNARGKFGPMMWAPILNNIVMIASGLLFIYFITGLNKTDPTSIPMWGIALLAGGSTLGVIVQTIALIPPLRRSGYHFTPRWNFRGFGLRKAAHLAKWTLLFVAANQVSYLVIARIGTTVSKAAQDTLSYGVGFSAYQNAYLILILPHAIATVSVVTALLPRMSAAAADGRSADIRNDISAGLRLCAVVIVPSAIAFLVLGREIGTVLYASAGTDSAQYIGYVLAAFGPGLLAFTGHYLALRGFYAQEDTRTPFYINVVINLVNIALVLVAYQIFSTRWVTVAMAGAYSLSYVAGMAVSFSVLRRRMGGLDGARVLRTYTRLLLAAVCGAVPAWLVAWLVFPDDGFVPALLALVVGGGLMAGIYLLLALQMRVAEVWTLLGMLSGRARRA